MQRGELFLVGRRPEGKVLAGYWEFPGGKIEPGETPEDAAVRECREESGLAVHMVGSLGIIRHAYPYGAVELHVFLCRASDEAAEPRAPFKWVDRSQLSELAFPEANRPILNWLSDGKAGSRLA